uniref:Reverse transcriptase zinc-binding domain-containing protein n=1 Tax=Manihot esculenta TaxID=3983 RepID=A0A2C9V525_MANES
METDCKFYWVKWENLCCSKFQGGLGFRSLFCFNQAPLMKLAWRLLENPTSFYFWKGVCSVILILHSSTCWRVGNGQSIDLWADNWIIGQNSLRPLILSFIYLN